MLSIVTPVLNGIKYLQNTIESIQDLDIPHEHIIVDGGSTDGTLELIKQYKNIRLLFQKDNLGMYAAIHQGFLASKGEYITWINADDIVIKKGYQAMYKFINQKKIDLVYSDTIYHYVESFKYKKMYARHFNHYLLKEGVMPFAQPSSIYTKSAYEKIGGLDYKRFKIIGDRDLFQRMAYNKELKFSHLPVFSVIFLMHSSSLFARNESLKLKEYAYCAKSKASILARIIFHISGILRSLSGILPSLKSKYS